MVCIEDGNHTGVADATAKASSLFLSAGVKLEWHSEVSDCKGRPDAMVVSFRAITPKTFHPAALAYAFPYEGVHIEVFYDRISQADPGLACHAGSVELSPVLQAMGVTPEIGMGAIRFSLGRCGPQKFNPASCGFLL